MVIILRTQVMQHVDGVVQTPDGRCVPVDYDDPMGCMGQIVQNDFAIMEQRGVNISVGGCVMFSSQLAVGGKI